MTGSSITERDLRALLDVVSPEAVASSGAEMPDQVFRGLAELIPCTSVNFYALDQHRRTGGPGQELLLQEGLFPPWTPEIDALFALLAAGNLPHYCGYARSWSDVQTV